MQNNSPQAILLAYAKIREISLGESAEETLNHILRSLGDETLNMNEQEYRGELISACAITLNGLSKIKDPVGLFKNLANAFEDRGYCIYTDTVVNAFGRLYHDSKKNGSRKRVPCCSLEHEKRAYNCFYFA